MAKLIFGIPDAALPRVVDALVALRQREYDRLPEPRPARAQFAHRVVANMIRRAVVAHESQQAAATAASAAAAAVERDVTVS